MTNANNASTISISFTREQAKGLVVALFSDASHMRKHGNDKAADYSMALAEYIWKQAGL